MQSRKTSNTRHVQSSQTGNPYARYMQADPGRAAILIGILCLLLPPVGIALSWRSKRMTVLLRSILSAVGFVSMTLIFFLLMRPDQASSDIRPTPVVPAQAGYGASVTEVPTAIPTIEPTSVPVQEAPVITGGDPSLTDPALTSPTEPPALTDDSIVYAVTNNASSYHMQPVCDMQENNRSLTLREALNEGLEPCEKCAGPVG